MESSSEQQRVRAELHTPAPGADGSSASTSSSTRAAASHTPGSSSNGRPAAATRQAAHKPAGGSNNTSSRIPQAPSASAVLTPAAAAAARQATAAQAAASAGAGAGALAANGTSTRKTTATSATSATSVQALQAMHAQDLRSATMGPDSSDWSDNSSSSSNSSSSTASSEAGSRVSPAAAGSSKHRSSRTRHGSKAQGSTLASALQEQCCLQGVDSPQQQHHEKQQEQRSSRRTNTDRVQQQQQQQQQIQQHSSTCEHAKEPQRPQQQQTVSSTHLELQQGQEQQQQQLQLGGQQGHPQQQQQPQQEQEQQSNGGPGPPGAAAAAGSEAAAAAAGGAGHAEAGGGGDAAAAAAAAATDSSSIVRARMSADPDYELPQGKLTETQVLLAHGSKLRLDRYGFIVGESDMAGRTAGPAATPTVRRQRSASQVRRDQRHVAKWRHMLGGSAPEFEAYCAAKLSKVKRRVRKGIPDEFRGYVWQLLSGGHALMRTHPGMYQRLLSHAPDAVDLEIMRDLNRTFPNHVFFHQRQGPGQQSLFHVLRAYSALDRQVGYVQGMGFVSAILLMYMSEEAAFWTLVALLKGTASQPPLEGLYQAGMPLLQQCLFQFHELLKLEHPRLGLHLEQEGVVPSMYCTHWFNTLFAYSLPFEQLLRVWDVFLLEGMKVVFRVGIALLASAQEQLCAMPFERLVAALNGRKFPILNKHPDSLMKAALRIPVSRQLEQLRQRFLALQAETEAAAAEAAAAAADGGGGAAGASAAAGGSGAASGSGGQAGRSVSGHTSKSSAAHARQQLIAGFAPVPMGPDS